MTQAKFKKYLLITSFGIFFSLFFVANLSFAQSDVSTNENKLKNIFKNSAEKIQLFNKKENTQKPQIEINKNKGTTTPSILADDSNMKNGNACFQIEKISTQANDKLTEQSAKLSAQRMGTTQKKEILAKTIDDKREMRRNAWDENFDARFNAISKSAKTPAQQQAAQNFKNTVTRAIAERRTQIDKATEDFRNGMTSSLEDQKTKIDMAVSTYHDAVGTAVRAAQTKCDDKASLKNAKDTFRVAMEDARKNFETNRAAIEKTKNTTQSLSVAHAAAIAKANTDFKAKIEAAAATLKAALKN
jgi:hypothetical protein